MRYIVFIIIHYKKGSINNVRQLELEAGTTRGRLLVLVAILTGPPRARFDVT